MGAALLQERVKRGEHTGEIRGGREDRPMLDKRVDVGLSERHSRSSTRKVGRPIALPSHRSNVELGGGRPLAR